MTRAGRVAALAVSAAVGALALLGGCDRDPPPAAGRPAQAPARSAADSAALRDLAALADRGDAGAGGAPRASAAWQLANATGGERYLAGPVTGGGVVEGRILGSEGRRAPGRDTSIVPTHDLGVCRPYTETIVPTRDGGVGQAVVWLAGVRAGPPDTTAMRARVALDGCRVAPRVQRVRQGSTLLVTSGDAMASQLRFTAESDPMAVLAEVSFTDAGQVVPVEAVTRAPGLVRVRDARHPWVLGVLAVAPHPWVAVTEADGSFRFGEVPPGRYTLVVWQEALGTRTQPLRVEPGVAVRLTVRY